MVRYGVKLTKLIEAVEQMTKARDRVLVFVQFPDLLAKVGPPLPSASRSAPPSAVPCRRAALPPVTFPRVRC
jgi:hypothetical protein